MFWEINNHAKGLWWTLDYLCDFIYMIDTLVHCHEGESLDAHVATLLITLGSN